LPIEFRSRLPSTHTTKSSFAGLLTKSNLIFLQRPLRLPKGRDKAHLAQLRAPKLNSSSHYWLKLFMRVVIQNEKKPMWPPRIIGNELTKCGSTPFTSGKRPRMRCSPHPPHRGANLIGDNPLTACSGKNRTLGPDCFARDFFVPNPIMKLPDRGCALEHSGRRRAGTKRLHARRNDKWFPIALDWLAETGGTANESKVCHPARKPECVKSRSVLCRPPETTTQSGNSP
jgi:hypothetical protein